MITKEELEEKAFRMFRNQVHEVAEDVKGVTHILISPSKEIPERLMNHLLDQCKCNNITFIDKVSDMGDDVYTHHLLIFKELKSFIW